MEKEREGEIERSLKVFGKDREQNRGKKGEGN